MGAVNNYTLQTFMADVKNEVANNNIQISSAEQADESIRQIVDISFTFLNQKRLACRVRHLTHRKRM